MTEMVTVGLFVYNHEKFIREAVEAIYAQTYRPLELIVSEDASSDASRVVLDEILRAVPVGIKVIRIYQTLNKGLSNAVNEVTKHASGSVIIFAAGDDISESYRIERTVAAFAAPNVMFVHAGVSYIDENSQPIVVKNHTNYPNKIHTLQGYLNLTNPPVIGASCAYRKEVFQYFGELDAGIIQEDAILPFRALLLGEGRYLDSPDVRYRSHNSNAHFGGFQQSSSEVVARIIRMQKNRLLLAHEKIRDLNIYINKGGEVPAELIKSLKAELLEAEFETDISVTPTKIARAWKIMCCLLSQHLRAVSCIKLWLLYVTPRFYGYALRLRKGNSLTFLK
jgi:glycosyltransferase involved in cell wall biosynthesis